jgi:hypothetical protein
VKYNLEVRSIAQRSQSIAEKHDTFVRGVQHLPPPWKASQAVTAPDPGSALSGVLNASDLFAKGVRGNVVYQFRRPFRDEGSEDDWIDLSFNPAKIDYDTLISEVFLGYAAAFDAYYADISDDEFIYMDFDRMKEARIDKRHSLYRLAPVSYMRRDFCKRALGLSPAQVAARLQGEAEVAREALDGVFVVLKSLVLATEEMDAICWKAKSRL